MAEQLASGLQSQVQYLTFTLEEEIYGIYLMPVQESLTETELAEIASF